MEGSYNACEMLYPTVMPLKPFAALAVIVTYLFLATNQSSPTGIAVQDFEGPYFFPTQNKRKNSGLAMRDYTGALCM